MYPWHIRFKWKNDNMCVDMLFTCYIKGTFHKVGTFPFPPSAGYEVGQPVPQLTSEEIRRIREEEAAISHLFDCRTLQLNDNSALFSHLIDRSLSRQAVSFCHLDAGCPEMWCPPAAIPWLRCALEPSSSLRIFLNTSVLKGHARGSSVMLLSYLVLCLPEVL